MPETWRVECKNNKYRLSREPIHSFGEQFSDFEKIWKHFKGDRDLKRAHEKLEGIVEKARSSGHSNQECLDRFSKELEDYYETQSFFSPDGVFGPREDIPPIDWIEK